VNAKLVVPWVALVLFGLIFLASGIWIVLMAADVIPTAHRHVGAPRWIVAAAGMLFVGAGLWLLTLPLTDGDRQGIVGGVLAASFVTFVGVFLTWVRLTGRARRGFVGVLALVFDAIAVVAWPVMLLSLWRHATGSRKPGAP